MTREELREIYNQYQEVDSEYHDYINQFFTKTWTGESVQRAILTLDRERVEKIKKLRERSDKLRQEWKDAMNDFFEK